MLGRADQAKNYRINRIAARQDKAGFTNFDESVPGKHVVPSTKKPANLFPAIISGFFIDGNNIALIAPRKRYHPMRDSVFYLRDVEGFSRSDEDYVVAIDKKASREV